MTYKAYNVYYLADYRTRYPCPPHFTLAPTFSVVEAGWGQLIQAGDSLSSKARVTFLALQFLPGTLPLVQSPQGLFQASAPTLALVLSPPPLAWSSDGSLGAEAAPSGPSPAS